MNDDRNLYPDDIVDCLKTYADPGWLTDEAISEIQFLRDYTKSLEEKLKQTRETRCHIE